MSLWLCLRFSQLPLQCLNRSEEQAVAVLERQRILRVNDCGAALGIRRGMSTATVRALAAPGTPVLLLERNAAAEQHTLQQLCCWAYSITPRLYISGEDCLQLEIGGCLKLFHGLNALLQGVDDGLSTRGYQVEYALAPTPGAAWLLSFSAAGKSIDTLQQPLPERLAPLPLTLLGKFPSTVDSLHKAGLHTLGDVLALPADALGRRCGKAFTHFLQQALGQRQDLRPHYQPPATYNDEYWFGYEVSVNEELFPAFQKMLRDFCQFLRNTQLQTADISWQLIGTDARLTSIVVRSSSSHSNWEAWFQLTRIHFERLQLRNRVEGLALSCNTLYAGEFDSVDLFRPHDQRESLASLLDRLRSRLGLQAVEHIACRDQHLPELAVHTCSETVNEKNYGGGIGSQRPFWLMPQPRALQCRGQDLYWNGKLQLVHGPERIEDNWWLEPVSRDYYIARGGNGEHYWIFRDRLAKNWFVHGVFA